MTTHEPTPAHRLTTRTSNVEYRQPDEEDGVFFVRMPIATTGEVRNEGDDPLSRDEIQGMAEQINTDNVGVFLDHGQTSLGGPGRYSAVEKIGEWEDAEIQEREADDEHEVVATARLMDPDSLPNIGPLREAIGAIREQVKRDMSLSASIGWRDDESFPGGVDLMEASIVGIGADPRTTSETSPEVVLARAIGASTNGFDVDVFVREVERETARHDTTMTETEQEEAENREEDEDEEEEMSVDEFRSEMLELQRAQMDVLESLARETDEDEDEEDEEEGSSDGPDEEQESESEETEENEGRDVSEELASLREELDAIRNGDIDVSDEVDTDSERDSEADETEEQTTEQPVSRQQKYGF